MPCKVPDVIDIFNSDTCMTLSKSGEIMLGQVSAEQIYRGGVAARVHSLACSRMFTEFESQGQSVLGRHLSGLLIRH